MKLVMVALQVLDGFPDNNATQTMANECYLLQICLLIVNVLQIDSCDVHDDELLYLVGQACPQLRDTSIRVLLVRLRDEEHGIRQ